MMKVANNAARVTTLANERLPEFKNAVPVVVAIVPVIGIDPSDGLEKIGVLAIRRAIVPRQGQLALPGGYLEYEDWRAAGLRELYEEANVDLRHTGELRVHSIESVEEGRRLLIFGVTRPIAQRELAPFVPNTESSERVVLFAPCVLAFPAHTEALRTFFESQTRHYLR